MENTQDRTPRIHHPEVQYDRHALARADDDGMILRDTLPRVRDDLPLVRAAGDGMFDRRA